MIELDTATFCGAVLDGVRVESFAWGVALGVAGWLLLDLAWAFVGSLRD